MTSPTVVIVFVDDDGDEFPVRVGAPLWPGADPLPAAERAAARCIAEGAWRPRGKLRVARTEADLGVAEPHVDNGGYDVHDAGGPVEECR